MIDYEEGKKNSEDSELGENKDNIKEKELNKEENELREKEKIRKDFYEKKCCYKEGFLGYIQEIWVIAIINITFIIIAILLNKLILFKNNNYINLIKYSSNSLTKFEKFWCNAGNAEFIGLIIYLVFLFIIFLIFIVKYEYIKRSFDKDSKEKFDAEKNRDYSKFEINEVIIKNKNKIIGIYFSLYIAFYAFYSIINYLIVYSIIFISISPIEYPGVFNIADKNKKLTLDEEIEIEDAVDEFKKSKHFHIIYIIILFIILYLNILITKLFYKSIIYVLEKNEEENKEQENKEQENKEQENKKQKNKKQKNKKQKNKKQEKTNKFEYIWKYPDINKEFKFLVSVYFGIFVILHLTISLFKLNINKEKNYQELLISDFENKMKRPKYYSTLEIYGNFSISVTGIFFAINLVIFIIIIFLMFKSMINNKIPQYLKLKIPKYVLLILNLINFAFIFVLIVLSGLCLSSFNSLDENENINYFVIKKKLIGQIIVNLFILAFLFVIIYNNLRNIKCCFYCCYCCNKKNNKSSSPTNNQTRNSETSQNDRKKNINDGSSSSREININEITNE